MKPSALTLVNLAIAALLLLTPFLVGVTASAPYDPWYDLDDNGAIDIFDVVRIAGTYGTTGDSARDYRINTLSEQYITNFQTLKTTKIYIVEVWRKDMLIGSFGFKTVK